MAVHNEVAFLEHFNIASHQIILDFISRSWEAGCKYIGFQGWTCWNFFFVFFFINRNSSLTRLSFGSSTVTISTICTHLRSSQCSNFIFNFSQPGEVNNSVTQLSSRGSSLKTHCRGFNVWFLVQISFKHSRNRERSGKKKSQKTEW